MKFGRLPLRVFSYQLKLHGDDHRIHFVDKKLIVVKNLLYVLSFVLLHEQVGTHVKMSR